MQNIDDTDAGTTAPTNIVYLHEFRHGASAEIHRRTMMADDAASIDANEAPRQHGDQLCAQQAMKSADFHNDLANKIDLLARARAAVTRLEAEIQMQKITSPQ